MGCDQSAHNWKGKMHDHYSLASVSGSRAVCKVSVGVGLQNDFFFHLFDLGLLLYTGEYSCGSIGLVRTNGNCHACRRLVKR